MERWHCAHCGDVIGIYEPVVVIMEGEHRLTSRAAEPDLPYIRGAHFHRECHKKQRGPSATGGTVE